MTNRETFAKMTLTCAKVAKLQKEQNEAIEVIKDCFCKTGIMYHPANEPHPEPAPKYSPCRLFRKGDKVRVIIRDGRTPTACPSCVGDVCVVREDEEKGRSIALRNEKGCRLWCEFFHLELITPVKELKRYVVIHNGYEKYYDVCWKDDDEPDGRTGRTRCLTTFWYHNPPKTHTQEHAKAAAEAECARLNAEYRKEVEK